MKVEVEAKTEQIRLRLSKERGINGHDVFLFTLALTLT